MATKISSPLFAADATGRIKALGTFIQRGSNFYLVQNTGGDPDAASRNPYQTQQFITAHALWMELGTTKTWNGTRFVWIRNPRWPIWWAGFLQNPPLYGYRFCTFNQAQGAELIDSATLRGALADLSEPNQSAQTLAAHTLRGDLLDLAAPNQAAQTLSSETLRGDLLDLSAPNQAAQTVSAHSIHGV